LFLSDVPAGTDLSSIGICNPRVTCAYLSYGEERRAVLEKILVVDDSDDTREMMAKLLELESFIAITAEDGRKGFDRAKAEHPDIIITDINMPNINGIEMIKMLRNDSEFSNIPIMAITAYGNSVVAEAIEAGANHASTKPIEFESLLNGIRQLLSASKGQIEDNPY
jgi:CheY-like chemotaxis protein